MQLVHCSDPSFGVLYQRFLEENDNVSWNYLPEFVEYQKVYASEKFVEDLSFAVVENNRAVSIAPLFLEKSMDVLQFSSGGEYLRAPLFSRKIDNSFRKKIERAVFSEIDRIGHSHNIEKILFLLDPLAECFDHNYLTEYGYLDTSLATAIIDLKNSREQLWKNLRKSFQAIINKTSKMFAIEVYDHANCPFDIHEKYRLLHHKAAGRVTRNLKTFEIQYGMLKNDHASLICLKHHQDYVAFSYFFHHQRSVYYGSSSDDPDFKTDLPLEHAILWAAVEDHKKRNHEAFEIGWQHFGEQVFDHPSKKDLSISFFKRGFGGETKPLYRGIKYFTKRRLSEDLNKNIEILLNNFEDVMPARAAE